MLDPTAIIIALVSAAISVTSLFFSRKKQAADVANVLTESAVKIVNELQEQLTITTAHVKLLDERASKYFCEMQDKDRRIIALEAKIEQLNLLVSTYERRVEELETQLSTKEARIGQLEHRIKELEQENQQRSKVSQNDSTQSTA